MRHDTTTEGSTAKARRRFLILIFSVAGGLLMASMALTFHTGRISIEAQDKMNSQLEVLNQIRGLESTIKDAETGQRGFLLTGEEAYLEPYNNALPKLKTQLAAMQKYVESGEIAKANFDRVGDLLQEKLAELALTIQLKREKGAEAALQEVRTDRGKNVMDQIRVNFDVITKVAQDNYREAVQQSNSTNLIRSIVFVAVTILNLGFLGWAFARILRQEWLQTGHSQLNEMMAGDPQVGELADKTIKFLAQYLDAQAGVMYIEEAGQFRLASTYAVPNQERLQKNFTLGEGITGQSVKNKKAFVLHDVPDGYLSIGSGLGQSRPRKIVVAPMMVDGSVNAVVEFGFFHTGYAADVELLERVSETVAIAVRSAKYRTRLQELLEETQRQAEELQSQSEELRVSNEELEEQSHALKESQTRLEQQQAELEQSNSQLEEQTQVLESQKDALTRAKADLEMQAAVVEQASRYKSDFLANMSHELRTPLNSSLILAKLLADNREGNLSEEQVKYAQTIHAAGNDLLNLINDVLDLAKVEAGRMDLKPEVCTVTHVNEAMRAMFEPLAANKGLTLKMTIAADAPASFETDRRRIEQVLKNLLSNAVKFTERGGVTVDVKPAGEDRIAFVVTDTGIGIAADQQHRIFEPFCQADGVTQRIYGGTGLGLSITRELTRLMGGTVQVVSEPGRGSTFTLTLPVAYGGERSTTSVPLDRDFERTKTPSAISRTPRPQEKTLPHPKFKRSGVLDDRDRVTATSRIILIIEDDESFAKILAEVSHEMNFQVLIAGSAEEGLVLTQQYHPSAVILDIGLPGNSGMFVLERLKSDSRTRHIPVHVVSGSDYAQPALSMGAVGYMLKPIKREELIDAFRKLEFRLTQTLRRVLVVEDDPVQLDSLRKLLGSRDVETVGAQTAAETLDKLKSATFDCMVLDLSLPDASGFSLLETLSTEQTYSFPPVIIYTGRELSMDEEQRLRKYSKSIIIKGAKSPERLLDEVTLFLHQVVSELPTEQQRMLEQARSRDAAMEGRTILIAEDDVRNIFALTSLLEPKGVKLKIARNGKEALKALGETEKSGPHSIDLVLMDIMMPEMNGLAAMREIRKNPKWRALPIIALTAKAMRDDQEQCIAAGANDYLAKPLDVEKLISLIRVWMPR